MYQYEKPISSMSEDVLGRASFSKLLARTLYNLRSSDTFTVGLYGKWGSGKTSIVNMALQELEILQQDAAEKTIVIHFEPWHFSDSKQLLNQFIIRLANEFSSKKDKAMQNIGKALESYSGAFALAELIPLVGSPIASLGKIFSYKLGKRIKNDINEKDILHQKAHIIKLLEKQKAKILVVIDDIDRLNCEQIRQIFQLVSSVAKFPNTAYLLVFDKDIVTKALRKVQEGNGEEYLHKVIQMPIQIPDVKEAKLHKILFDNLSTMANDYDTSFNLERWKSIFLPCVSPFISTLRDVYRLLNSLQFKLATISSEIEFSDMVAVCAIEIGAPKVFEWIKQNKNILLGEIDIDYITTRNRTASEWYTLYTEKITPLIEDHIQVKGRAKNQPEAVLYALSYLFPAFGNKVGLSHASVTAETARKNCYICNSDKFNRYFDLDIDGIFITKAEVQKILFQESQESIESLFLEKNSNGSLYELLEEIRAALPDLNNERLKVLFASLMNVVYKLESKDSRNFLGHSTYTCAENLTIDILNVVEKDERSEFFLYVLRHTNDHSLGSFAYLINTVELAYGKLAANGQEQTSKEKSFTEEELSVIEKAFVDRCKEALETISIFDISKWRMILHLLRSFDCDFTDKYMESALESDTAVVKYIFNISSAWQGTGISYEIQKPPYDYVTDIRITEAIEHLIETGTLFDLDQDVQERAAAFYLNSKGLVSYDGCVTQGDAIKFLHEQKNTPK